VPVTRLEKTISPRPSRNASRESTVSETGMRDSGQLLAEMGTEMVKFLQFEPCFSTRDVAMPKERRTARMARNWDFIVTVSTLVVQWRSDWMAVTERGVIKRGVIERRGGVERKRCDRERKVLRGKKIFHV
jgi:hypothetical protein